MQFVLHSHRWVFFKLKWLHLHVADKTLFFLGSRLPWTLLKKKDLNWVNTIEMSLHNQLHASVSPLSDKTTTLAVRSVLVQHYDSQRTHPPSWSPETNQSFLFTLNTLLTLFFSHPKNRKGDWMGAHDTNAANRRRKQQWLAVVLTYLEAPVNDTY